MANVTETIKNSIMIVNAAFLSDKGTVQCYACRERGDANGKTIKVGPASVKGRALLAGDVLYVSDAVVEGSDTSNYRTLRSGHIDFELPTNAPEAAATAEDADVPFI